MLGCRADNIPVRRRKLDGYALTTHLDAYDRGDYGKRHDGQAVDVAAVKYGMNPVRHSKPLSVLHLSGMLALVCLLNLPAHADSALSYRVSTFGFGLDYNYRLRDTVTARLGYNFYGMGQDADSDGIQYDAKVKIAATWLLVDLHRADSPWRLSLGLSESGPRFEAQGTATGTVTFNDQTYTADKLGNIDVSIKPRNAIAPYVGIGYGQAVGKEDRFTFIADLGVLYVGAPTSKVIAECGTAVTSTECDQLVSDIRTEAAAREEEWRHLQWWPVLSIGFAMRW